MTTTPDRHPGPIDEDEHILLEPQTVHPTTNGQFAYVKDLGFRLFEEGVERGLGIDDANVVHKTGDETVGGLKTFSDGLDVVGAMTQGSGNSATGEDSFAGGTGSEAGGTSSHAEGIATSAGGPGGHAEGSSTYADGSGSHAQGISSYAGNTGQEAWASGCFEGPGDAQVTQAVLRGTTLGIIPGEEIELLLGPAGNEKLIFNDMHTYTIFLEAVATSGNVDRFCMKQMVLAHASMHPMFTWHFDILGVGTQEVLSTGLGVDWTLRVASIYVPPSMGHPAGSRFGILFNIGASQIVVNVVCNVRVVEVVG